MPSSLTQWLQRNERIKNESLNIATSGCTLTILPFFISNPAGVFMNELTAVIKNGE